MVGGNNKSIEVIFFDIGGVLLHIHPKKMLKHISMITSVPFEIVKNYFPEDDHDTYERGQITDSDWFKLYKNSLPINNNLTENQFWEAWSMILGDETDVIDILIRLKNN